MSCTIAWAVCQSSSVATFANSWMSIRFWELLFRFGEHLEREEMADAAHRNAIHWHRCRGDLALDTRRSKEEVYEDNATSRASQPRRRKSIRLRSATIVMTSEPRVESACTNRSASSSLSTATARSTSRVYRGSPHADTARPPTNAKLAPSSASSAAACAAASIIGSDARVFLAMAHDVQVHRALGRGAIHRAAHQARPRREKDASGGGYAASSRYLRAAFPSQGEGARRRSHEA